jgi:hypothetical protein
MEKTFRFIFTVNYFEGSGVENIAAKSIEKNIKILGYG